MTDIQDIDDVKKLVDQFYENVRQDDLIGPIFEQRIGNNWEEHLVKMYSFWETILLENHTYHGSPFYPHAQMPIGDEHFERWIAMFVATVNELYEGAKANEAIERAKRMAGLFASKKKYIDEMMDEE